MPIFNIIEMAGSRMNVFNLRHRTMSLKAPDVEVKSFLASLAASNTVMDMLQCSRYNLETIDGVEQFSHSGSPLALLKAFDKRGSG